MPSEDGKLSGDGDDRDGVAPPACDPGVERVERTRPAGGTKGGLDEPVSSAVL